MNQQYSQLSLVGVQSRESGFSNLRTQTLTKASYSTPSREANEITIDEIRYKYKLGQSNNFINRELKIQNQSAENILFFIVKCNNPLHYTVRPSQGDIPPGKTLEISIQINRVEEVIEIGRNFFAKLASDMFKVELYESTFSKKPAGERIPNSQKQKILKVYIDYSEQPVSTRQLPKQQTLEMDSKIQQAINLHKKEISRLQILISQQQKRRIKSEWVSGRCLWLFGVSAFIVGILMPI